MYYLNHQTTHNPRSKCVQILTKFKHSTIKKFKVNFSTYNILTFKHTQIQNTASFYPISYTIREFQFLQHCFTIMKFKPRQSCCIFFQIHIIPQKSSFTTTPISTKLLCPQVIVCPQTSCSCF